MSNIESSDVESLRYRVDEAWSRLAPGRGDAERVEVYVRASRRLRVRLTRGNVAIVEQGRDEGTAVRVHREASGSVGFAAVAGIGPEATAWARESARRATVPASPDPWMRYAGLRWDERAREQEDTDPRALEAWIREALRGASLEPAEDPWIEVADTVEGARYEEGGWIRSRRRVLAVLVAPVVARKDAEPVSRLIAGPALTTLPSRPWSPPPRTAEPGVHSAPADEENTVIFTDESVGPLVSSLVGSLDDGESVGAGWIVRNDPQHPRALAGGVWDDAGFPSRPRRLADGARVVGAVVGPGCRLRGSFRDPPEPAPALLVVEPPAVGLPAKARVVLAARIHRVQEAWWIEVDGVVLDAGSPSGAICHGWIRTSPRELVARCVGGIGKTALRGGAVLSPALRFDGLRVEE